MTYEVLKHPEVLLKLRAEIDEVLGDRLVSLEDLSKMSYTVAVLRETLRLWPPSSNRSVYPVDATTVGNGKYAVAPGDIITVNVTQIHRDPEVWGDDVRPFRLFLVHVGVNAFIRDISSSLSECWTGSSRHCQWVASHSHLARLDTSILAKCLEPIRIWSPCLYRK